MQEYQFQALASLLGMNIVTFLAFAWDKQCAIRGSWRVRESTLLLFAFLGTSPAAKIAQRLFRHKTRKQPFGLYLNLIFGVHIVGLAIWCVPSCRRWIMVGLDNALANI